MHETASLGVQLGIASLAVVVAAGFVLGIRAVRPDWAARAALLTIVWIAVTGAVAASHGPGSCSPSRCSVRSR